MEEKPIDSFDEQDEQDRFAPICAKAWQDVHLSPSPIHGYGLFASIPFRPGERICDYLGEEIPYSEFKERYGPYSSNSEHCYYMKRIHRVISAKGEPYRVANPVNFVNESSTPNCILKKRGLYAADFINQGQELTLRYPKDYNRYWVTTKTD